MKKKKLKMTLKRIKSQLVIGFILILTILLINAGISYWNVHRMRQNQVRLTQTYEVLDEIQDTLNLAIEAETGTRGYIITGKESYLTPYQYALDSAAEHFRTLERLVANDSPQRVRVKSLEAEINQLLEWCKNNILIRELGVTSDISTTALDAGKQQMDTIRTLVSQMQNTETIALTKRAAESQTNGVAASLTIVAAFTITLVLLGAVYVQMARAEVQKEELAHTYSELQRLEGMRDNLTAMLVHDLRTPLATMITPMEMLSNELLGTLEPTQKEMATMSVQGGYRLLNLINELLDISKMEAGEMRLRLDTVQVSVVGETAIGQVARLDLGDTARIVRDFADDLPLMQADQEILTRVLINLLGNALKFTPKTGTITLSARLASPRKEKITEALLPKAGKDAGTAILFAVKDTGEGIPKDHIGKIFDKFGQVESRTGGRKMSSGLGLTFCKLAVEAHGGHIWVESVIGTGSTFFFTVPLRPQEAAKIEEYGTQNTSD